MKSGRITALVLSVMMVLSSFCVPAFAAVDDASAAAANYGTVTKNDDGSTTLALGSDSVSGGGSVKTSGVDGVANGTPVTDRLKNGAKITLPDLDLNNSGYDKVEFYAGNENTTTVTIKVGGTQVASLEGVTTGAWASYQLFTADLSTTAASGPVTLEFNVTTQVKNDYAGNYHTIRFFDSNAKPVVLPYQDESLSFEERAADLVSRMTLEEKVSQIGYKAEAIDRLGVAAYDYWKEALHGVARQGKATSFPTALSMSNTWNRDLILKMADVTSGEARAKNSRLNLSYWSPTVNMARDPRWGRNEETYGEDPYLTGQLGAAFVKGMQGDDEKYLKTIATLKHFAANNNETARSSGSSEMTEFNFRNYYTRVFQNITEIAMPASVMSSYNATTIHRGDQLVYNFIPSLGNSYLLQDLLRRNWGFSGYVTSDCGAGEYLLNSAQFKQGMTDDASLPDEAYIAEIFKNGLNVECNLSGGNKSQNLGVAAVENGYLSEQELERVVYELFLQRFKTGEFDADAPYRDYTSSDIESDSNVQAAEDVAEESWVLLKNDNALPLTGSVSNVAIVGNLADKLVLGDYTGEPTKTKTPVQGITEEVKKVNANAEVNHLGVLSDSTLLYNVKSVNFVLKNGSRKAVDLTKAADVKGMTLTSDGQLKDVTPAAYAVIKDVDFKDVVNVEVEMSTGSRVGGSFNIAYGSVGSFATVNSSPTADLDTYATCKLPADITDTGGYDGVSDMIITATGTVADFSVDNYKSQLDAADVIIAYAATVPKNSTGLGDADSSESKDRSNIDLPATQAHVQALCNAYPEKTIVAMSTVGQINVEPFKDKCKAILWTSYNGQTQGTALGKVLTGQVNPSGRLTTTWYKNDDVKKMELAGGTKTVGAINGRYTNYDIQADGTNPGHTYQYYTGTPVYPFGYGLSYTSFEYSNMKVSGGHAVEDPNPYTITGAEYAGGKLNVTYTKKDGAPDATLIAAAYSDFSESTMVETKSVKVDGSGSQSIEITEPQGGKTKVYIWENTDSIKPLSYAKTVGEAGTGAPASGADANGKLTFSVDVKNTGSTAGKEVVQLYVSHPNAGQGTIPAKQLKGFEKVELRPGETKTVSIELNVRDMYLFDEDAQKDIVLDGTYTAYMASSAADTKNSAQFEVTGTLDSKLKTVKAVPSGISVNGLIADDGTGLETVEPVDANLSAVMTDEVKLDLSQAQVSYTSSNNDVAAVDANGRVSSGKTQGVAMITATVTYGGDSMSTTFPVVNKLKSKASSSDKAAAEEQIKAVYDALPKTAYTAESRAKLKSVYDNGVKAVNNAVTKDDVEALVESISAELKSVPMDALSVSYTIDSGSTKFLEDGVIDYRDGGIPMYNGAIGTVTETTPYVGQLRAVDASGNPVDNSKLMWQATKLDSSGRKVAEINSETGELTVYGNGVIQVTAANIEAGTCARQVIRIDTQIEAETGDDGGTANLRDNQSGSSGGFDAGSTGTSWILFKSVNIEFIDRFTARVAGRNAGMINVSLAADNKAENVIASKQADPTGAWNAWTEIELDVNSNVLEKARTSGKLDRYGCADIYIQTNGVNLDYFKIDHYVPNDDQPYTIDKVLNRANGSLKVSVTYRGSAAPRDVILAAEVSGRTVTSNKINGGGDYEVTGLNASEGDSIKLYVINNTSEKKVLSNTVEHTYSEPVPSDIEVISLDSKYTDGNDYSKLTSGDNADGTALGVNVNGVTGFGSWKIVDSAAKYTYKDINENEYNYDFTKAWQAGGGSTSTRNFYFTPKKVPCRVSAIFLGSEEKRSMKIYQSDTVQTETPGGNGVAMASLEITKKAPVYVYGGSSNKQLYAIVVEYYGSAEAMSAGRLDSDAADAAEDYDRPVQNVSWNGTEAVLTKNDLTGESKVFTVGFGGALNQLSTDYFYSSDIPYSYGDKYNINAIAEYKGRLYAACDGGLVIMFTDCAKCYQLRKAADIDLKTMTIEGGVMTAGDGTTELQIPMSDLGGDSIEADEASVMLSNGAVLIDVRTADEYAVESAEGSINIPLDEIEAGLSDYGKDAVIIFCCASGGRAAKAVETAKAMGFANVYNLGAYSKLK